MIWSRLLLATLPAIWVAGLMCIAIVRERQRYLQARARAAADQAVDQLRLDTIAALYIEEPTP